MIIRIISFSFLAALLLYVPFYYFAPYYRELYQHVDIWTVNWWNRWPFSQHNGIQIYVAYALMYLAVGLTTFFEYAYLKIIPPSARVVLVVLAGISGLYYLWSIGFYPPMAAASLNIQNILFVLMACVTAFIGGRFFNSKIVTWLLISLIFGACMAREAKTGIPVDYFYFLTPALRTIKGCALNQSYFQYDHLLSFFGMWWMKFKLPLDRFFVVAEFFYALFFTGIYFMTKRLFVNKPLAIYFILSLIIIRMYAGLGWTVSLQGNPLRLDMWLLVLALAYWKGIEHWSIGAMLGFFLVFHHAYGLIYSLSYVCLCFCTLLLKDYRKKVPAYLLNACLMAAGMAINHFFIASKAAPGMKYIKYNISFMPIDSKSFFWYVPVLLSTFLVLLWKRRSQLSLKYFQTGTFLVFLSIGNSIYFFGRSHENNLLNISACLWMVFFMLIDLILQGIPQAYAAVIKYIYIPVIGVFIVGAAACFYSDSTTARIAGQMASLPKIMEYLEPDQEVNLDLDTVKTVTGGSPDVVFISTLHDLEYYYQGGYTPPEFAPFDSQIFVKDTMKNLDDKLEEGAYLIVPQKEFNPMIETILRLKAKYIYKMSDFVYISNNQPI